MKKLLVILLLTMYGMSSFGMTVNFHYCCGKLKKVAFTSIKTDLCDMEPAAQIEMEDCCKNKTLTLKIKDVQSPSAICHAAAFSDITFLPARDLAIADVQHRAIIQLPEYFLPPPLRKHFTSLYCVYRI